MTSQYKHYLLCTAALAGALLNPSLASASMFSDFADKAQEYIMPDSKAETMTDTPPLADTPAEPVAAPIVPAAAAADNAPSVTDQIVIGGPQIEDDQKIEQLKKDVEAKPGELAPPLAVEAPKDDKAIEAPVTAQPEPAAADHLKSEYEKLLDEKAAEQAKIDAANPAPQPNADDVQLKAALEHVYENHPQIQAQREQLKATDEGVSQALSGFRPNAEADVSKGRNREEDTTKKWEYFNGNARGITITQPIFNGGETIASYASAKDRVLAGRAQLSALEQEVLYNAVVAYTDVVEKQAVLELNQKNVDVLKQQLEASQARFDVGELTVTDVAQSTSRLATAQAAEREALGDLESSKITFKRSIGYDVPEHIGMPSVPANLPASVDEANDWAQTANPTLEAAKKLQRAAEHDVYVQGSALLPNVSLQGSMSRATGVSSTLPRLDEDALTVNVTIPLYQSGAEWSRIREARNVAQQAKFTMLDTHESVIEGATHAWDDFNTASAVITSNDSAVKAAETALDGVRKENEFGVRTVLDVLDAEQEAFTARVNLVKAVRAEKVQAYRLLASVGKLTAKDLNLQTDVPSPKEHYDSVKYQLLGL